MKKGILRKLADNGVLVDPEAVDVLSKIPDAMKYVDLILQDGENRPLVLTRADVEGYVSGGMSAGRRATAPLKVAPKAEAVAPSRPAGSSEVKVLKDITGNSTCIGNVIDFAKLFNDRYSTLRRVLSRRRELAGAVPVAKAKRVLRDVKVIGIVNNVYVTKNGHTMLELEDEDDRVQVLMMKGSFRTGDTVLRDEVIGVVGSFSKDGDIMIAKEVIWPEVPINSVMLPSDSESLMAFVSDLHVGSTTFLSPEWDRFVEWLKRDTVARDIRYMIMPGDIVEGIGVYPGQEEELTIDDIYGQYMESSKLIGAMPDWIKIIVLPGNHDAVRLAEPQPALPHEVRSMFDSNVMFVGNPSYLEIEGRTVLAYHGYSMNDFVSNTREFSWDAPIEMMKGMLRRRHLAPVYGGKTPLAPEQRDYLVIDRVPNIFVTGHVHACGLGEFRGIKLVNASTWQSQTSFQRMQNINPNPAKVPIVHLGTGEMWVESFIG